GEQPALAFQPYRLGLDQAAWRADIDADQLRLGSCGELRAPPQDVPALGLAGQGGHDRRAPAGRGRRPIETVLEYPPPARSAQRRQVLRPEVARERPLRGAGRIAAGNALAQPLG